METQVAPLANPDNIAVALYGKNDLRVEQWPIPKTIKPNDCLIKTNCCGICGTDIHLWVDGYMSDFVLKKPTVLGHETSGTVVQVGSQVTTLKPGDRVTVEPAVSCLKCNFCRSGRYNLCALSTVQAKGLPPKDGCLRRYYTHPEGFLFKIPDNVSFREAAMCEPFAVVVHACRRLDIRIGHNVLVCGAGAMGLMSMLSAKAFGADQVAITDVDPEKLKLAKQLGADFTYLIDPKNFDPKQLGAKIKTDMHKPPEVSMECTGNGASTNLAIYTTEYGGKVGVIGLGKIEESVTLVTAAMREIDLITVCRFKDDFPLAIHLLATGKVNLKPLCTESWKVENALEAFELMKNGKSGTVKTMIDFE